MSSQASASAGQSSVLSVSLQDDSHTDGMEHSMSSSFHDIAKYILHTLLWYSEGLTTIVITVFM